MTTDLLVQGGRVLDVRTGEYADDTDVRIEAGRIVEVGRGLTAPDGVRRLDASGHAVLPGLIDAHVHVTAATADFAAMATWSANYAAAHTARIMSAMLDRGFTTVRDVAGADFGLAAAQAEGLLRGPRLFFGGKALSQTGGHGDDRTAGQHLIDDHPCNPANCRVVDGVDAIRRATRDELRKGAHHIKVMASGGVASPTDRVDSVQYSADELRAVVEEAEAANRYVTAHAYTSKAVVHAVRAGIRSIEHGNLIDAETVALLQAEGTFLIPTLVTYQALADEGAQFGLPPVSQAKVDDVLHAGLHALELAARGGVRIAYGTDLLGGMHRHQSREFAIRGKVLPPLTVIQQATVNAAELVGEPERLGEIRAGAAGDLILLDGDPIANLDVLAEPDRTLRAVVQAGEVVS